ncbi:MAG: hypothetical protein FADNKDHG_01634 [Holosporales bacterium]
MSDIKKAGDASRKMTEAEKKLKEIEALQRRDSFIALEKSRSQHSSTGRFVDGKFRPNTHMSDVEKSGDASIILELQSLKNDPGAYSKKQEDMANNYLRSFLNDDISLDQLIHKIRVVATEFSYSGYANSNIRVKKILIERMNDPYVNAKESAQKILNLSQEDQNILLHVENEYSPEFDRILVKNDYMDTILPVYNKAQTLLHSFVSGEGNPVTFQDIFEYLTDIGRYLRPSNDESDITVILYILGACTYSWENSTAEEQKKYAQAMLDFMDNPALLKELMSIDSYDRRTWLEEHKLMHVEE